MLEDPQGAAFFGCSLWQVPDANIWRWRAWLRGVQRVLDKSRG